MTLLTIHFILVAIVFVFAAYHAIITLIDLYKSKTFKPSVIEVTEGWYFKRLNHIHADVSGSFPISFQDINFAYRFTDYDTAKTFLHLVKKFHKNAKLVTL